MQTETGQAETIAVRIQVGGAPDVAGTPMAGVEMQTFREGLGLSRAELLTLLNRGSEKQVQVVQSIGQWETGKHDVPDGVARALTAWVDEQAEIVDQLVIALNDERDVVLTIPRGEAAGRPSGYWRAVAFQVAQLVPELRVRYPDLRQ